MFFIPTVSKLVSPQPDQARFTSVQCSSPVVSNDVSDGTSRQHELRLPETTVIPDALKLVREVQFLQALVKFTIAVPNPVVLKSVRLVQ